jgi:hypothetical protein
MFHDMTPVTSRIADGKKDGSIQFLRFPEGFFPPGIPVYWVVSVLEEVGAGFVS